MPFHVFLSHSSTDKPAVEELARWLAKEGIQAWLDKWNLIPGAPWQPALEKALAESETCAVFVGPSGFGPWQNEEMRAAIDQRVRDSGRRFRVIPVLLPGAERAERSSLPTFLAATTWVEFPDSLDDADAFHRLVCGIRGVEPGAGPGQAIYEGQCPYRGLRVFDVDDAAFFFGREALVQWLLNAVRPATEGQPINRFLAIVGASGSGKSSVARAGLAAALKHEAVPGSSRWPFGIFRPGPDPLESLAVALSRVVNAGQGALALSDLIEGFQKNEKTLHLIARQSLPENAPELRLVILVDQFEEIFTLCRKDELQDAFVRNLLYAAKVTQGQTLVILTMRADFYGKCATNADLAAALSDHHVLVGPMTEDELRRAIERPTKLVGCELESGLVDLLVQDVCHQPGALPLLQHTLLELWNKRDGRRLSVKAYQEIGKLEGALQRRADATLEALSEQERELCRKIFLRLTQPGEGTEDTKRRASIKELLSLADTSTAEESIIQKLANAALLTTEGDLTNREAFVEVAHEALIRNWPQLRRWIEVDRAGLRTRTRLTEAAREWKNAGCDPAYLYTGARLAVAEEWAGSHPKELNADESEFLRCSREAQKQREATELEAARKLAGAFRERAEEAEKREQEQKEFAEKLGHATEAAQKALTASFFRTIGVSGTDIPTGDEREALWELAQLDPANAAVRDKMLNRWFESVDAFKRGNACSGRGFRAATGLNVEYYQLATSKAAELADHIAKTLKKTPETDSDQLLALGEALAALANKMEPQAAAEIGKRGAQRLAAAMENPKETSYGLSCFGEVLAALTNKMEPQAAREIGKRGAQRLAAALENSRETDYFGLSSPGKVLAALANKMEPQAAAEIARGLAENLEKLPKTNSRKRLLALGEALAAMINRIEPEAAAEFASRGAQPLAMAFDNPQEIDSDWLFRVGQVLAALANRMEPQAAAEVAKRGAQRLAAALKELKAHHPLTQRPNRGSSGFEPPEPWPSIIEDRALRLCRALAALASKMEPQPVAEIARGLAEDIEKTPETDLKQLLTLGRAVAALANKMEPQAAAEIGKRGAQRLAAALENSQETSYGGLSSFGEVLAALANKMEPQAAAEIGKRGAQRLAAALENPLGTDYFGPFSSGEALATLANKMERRAATEIAKGLAGTFEKTPETDFRRLVALGKALAALANKIEPQVAAEIASRGAQRLATALETPGIDSYRLSSLGRALAALANKLESHAVAEIARRLAKGLEHPQETASDRLWGLGSVLTAVCWSLPLAAHRTRLLALSNMLLRPVPESKERFYVETLSPGLEDSRPRLNDGNLFADVCALLRPQDLAEVLKYPFSTVEVEQIVLNELETMTGRTFGGDVWKFVEQADSLDIKDIGGPAQRPSPQDALNELNKL